VRILAVNWLDPENPQAGGAEVHLFEILERLGSWGHEVTVACSGWNDSAPRTDHRGVRVRRFGNRHTFALKGRKAVRALLREQRFDVVVEDINKLPLYLPAVTDLPFYVIVPHLFGTTAFQEAPLPIASVVWAAELPIPWIYRRAEFQAISDSTRDDLVRRGVPRDRIRVIYPGVDAEWYKPETGRAGEREGSANSLPLSPSPALRSSHPTFLYIGRLKRYKGIDTAIRAVAIANERGCPLTLVVAGTGDDRRRLEALVRDLRVADRVRFAGFVDEDEKRRLYRRAWAVVLPSAKEGWGLTNLEAAACGTPAIGADRPGVRETVRHEETGLLVPYGDPDALANALVRMASDPGLVARYGAAARRFATSLPWDKTARATEAHLLATLERSDSH
jgi:glycosyltransferase involved in cell wall biosynthesis